MLINQKVLVSAPDFFNDSLAINAHMDNTVPVNAQLATTEHTAIVDCFKKAGITVVQVAPPKNCQDGVYTANWALVHNGMAVLSNLPPARQPEEPYARQILKNQGLEVVSLPKDIAFSGQGDALICGDYLFVGSKYRTNPKAYYFLEKHLGLQVIGVQTIPQLDKNGRPVINKVTGWPDSLYYDLDLALAVIDAGTIAWCPQAFTPESRAKIKGVADVIKIEVSLEEATKGFACNLVSTGTSVIMSDKAPQLQAALEAKGLKAYTPHVTELLKGGGFIRCISLTL